MEIAPYAIRHDTPNFGTLYAHLIATANLEVDLLK
jgi:hypothetical protein